MNPSLVSHGFATLPPLPGCALTPLLRPRPRQTAPAAVLASAVLQTWRRHNRHRGPCDRGSVAVNGADFLNALDQEDPGRSSLRAEWAVPGDLVFEHGSTNDGANGLVRVTGSGASSGGSWRRLRFNETTEQSVLLLDASLRPRYEALAFGYLKSLAAVGSASLRCLGTAAPWRILVLGVGLGALPGWFATKAKALVHAVDLDPMVLDAASSVGAMPPAIQGLQACLADAQQNLSAETVATYCCDGVEYVAACAKEAVHYDLIVIDVFDGQGNTPETFLTEDFGRNCAAISTACVVNLTCPVPMWEDAHSYNAPSAGRLADAFQSSFQSKVWSVRVPEGQNLIMAATRMGAPPEKYLEEAALELAQENLFAFDPVRRVSFRRQDW